MCDKVLIISKGRLVAYDDTEKLTAQRGESLEDVLLELTDSTESEVTAE